MNSILILSIFSILLQNFCGYLKFKNIINPIFLFSIIHFFHNWSFSLSRYFNEIMIWNAYPDVSYSSIYEVLYINLLGGWVFFFMVIIFAKTKEHINYSKFTKTKVLLNGYYLLSLVYFLRFIINFDPNTAFGAGQALDSVSAFNPISQIIFFRIIMCVVYIFSEKVEKKTILKIILIEIFFSLISFGRKDIIFILSSYFLKVTMNSKINIISNIKSLLTYTVGFVFLMFIPIYRSVNYVDGLYNKFNETFLIINEYGYQFYFYILNLANSEGVQNWTYQLVQNGEITLLYGKSYLQALINVFVLRPFQGSTIASWQGAYYFKSVAYPNVTYTGWDFTFTAEAIQNFGPNFAFISFGVLGLIISYFYSMRNKGDFNNILYLFTWPILIIGFRMDSTSVLRLYSYILVIYLYFYFSKKIKIAIDEKN